MKKSRIFSVCIILLLSYTGYISQATAQGIRNEGATINVASGCYVVCQGGLTNNGGVIANNGAMAVSGAINSTGVIGGDGSYYLKGNIINNGTITPGTGAFTFNGSTEQVISGSSETTFNDLVIDLTSAGTRIAPGAKVTVSGNTFSPNGKLTIDCDALNNNGSLIYSGSGTPSGNVTYNRLLRPDAETGDKHLFSSPVGGQDIGDFIGLFGDKIDFLRTWDEVNAYWPDITGTSGNFISGKGYNVYQAEGSNGDFSFTGTIVSSASVPATSPYAMSYQNRLATYPLDPFGVDNHELPDMWATPRSWFNWGGGGWNLLGNPFTSAMDAEIFITANQSDFDPYYMALYVYDGPSGTYKYVAPEIPFDYEPFEMGGGPYGSIIQAGQGFMVLANNNGVNFEFTKDMQTHAGDVFMLKSAQAEDPWPGLRLKVTYGEKTRATTVVYNDKMTAGLDPGYDLGLLSTSPAVEIYTAMAEKDEGVNLACQALPLTGADEITIPVGVDTEEGGEVTFSAYTVPIEDKKFWLEDRTTGIFTDLTTKSYTVTLPTKSYGTGRFYIVASANTPTGIEEPEADNTEIRIWTSNNKVIVKGDVSGRARCEVFDVNGGKIIDTRLTGGELNTIDLPGGIKGVLIVRVIDGVKVTTGKIALP